MKKQLMLLLGFLIATTAVMASDAVPQNTTPDNSSANPSTVAPTEPLIPADVLAEEQGPDNSQDLNNNDDSAGLARDYHRWRRGYRSAACWARNDRGYYFRGDDFYPRSAQWHAMRKCYNWGSRNCWSMGCTWY